MKKLLKFYALISKAVRKFQMKTRHYRLLVFSLRRTLKRQRLGKCKIRKEFKDCIFVPGNFSLNRLFLNKIDLSSGKILKNTYSGGGHGHSVVISAEAQKGWLIPENGYFITEFELDTLKPVGVIKPDKDVMGGHGSCSQNGRKLYFVDRGLNDSTLESSLIIFDTDTRKVLRKVDNIGIFAHDVQITSDERLAIVASYGQIFFFVGQAKNARFSRKNLMVRKPSFAVIDIESGKILQKHIFDSNFALSHAVVDSTGKAAYVQGTLTEIMNGKKEKEIGCIIKKRGIALTQEEKHRGTIFLNGVQFKINLENFTVQKLKQPLFYRTQSLAFSEKLNEIYESHAISRKITVIDANSYALKRVIDCAHAGVSDPRGLALTHDSKFLVITDRWKNIYFFDIEKGQIAEDMTFASYNWLNSHISICSSSID